MGDNQPMWGRRSKVHFTPRSAIKKTEDKDVEISEELIKMIGKVTFDGKPTEEPYQHIEAFENICDLFKTKEDEVKLRLFHFTLTGKAKDWFRKLPQESIATWEELKSAFLSRLRLDSCSGGIFAYRTVKDAHKLLDDLEAHHLDWSTDEEETKPVQVRQGKVNADVDRQIQIFASHIAGLQKDLGHMLRIVKEAYPYVYTDMEDPAEVFVTTGGGCRTGGRAIIKSNGRRKGIRPKESVPIPNLAQVPYPARLRKEKKEAQYRMPNYVKFIKVLVSNKANLGAEGIAFLNAECSAILSDTPKKGDPGSFTIPCYFGKSISCRALADLGASINLMPLSFYQKLGLGDLKNTRMTIQLADRSIKYPVGIAEDVLVQVDKFVFLADFVILDIKDEVKAPLILGRPFLNTANAIISVAERRLRLGIGEDRFTFSIDQAMSKGFSIEHENRVIPQEEGGDEFEEIKQEDKVRVKTSLEEPPDLELKDLPEHLEYQFLEGTNSLPVIISSLLKPDEKERLLAILKTHKKALAWKISDILGISPSFCTHKILMEDSFKPCVQKQRRLNPKMQEVVKKEVIKLLDTGIIYHISDSPWASPVQVVPKKGGLTVITNDNNELVPTRTVTGTSKDLVDSLRKIDANVRWPNKSDNPSKDKGQNKWCDFHEDHAKRHARDGPDKCPIPDEVKSKAEKELDAMTIPFDKDDTQGSANVIFADTLKVMGIEQSEIVRRSTTLIGFNGDSMNSLGEIILPVFAKRINKQTKFIVIDCQSAYNSQDGKRSNDDLRLEEVMLDPEHPDRKEHPDCFIWSNEDMVGIDPNVISHKLNVDPTFKPIKQKRRKFAPERNKVINDEVDNLLKTGKIREVKYPDWLANVVVVQKKNGKWRVCIDFTDLNKACPKDPFPLPHIDAMVDATAGHELLTFMDAYSGYNQILMHTEDQEKTAFMTDKGIYCYKVMPFGLKNAGSTYQRLVNMMFKEHLGRTMEVYIDDMLVKSERSIDHVSQIHLKQLFDILWQYKMKLNPTKCSFGVRARKFLGYMVTQRGIESSPEQLKAIAEIQSLRNVKEVQKLTGRVAALNRFISRSSDKCHLFYNVLRKNQGFQWTNDHEKALQDLKQYMVSPPLLTKPVKGESLQLYLAVSNNATSAVLVREKDQQQQPIYYISKSFLDAETRYTSMEKLLLGLVTAAKKLRHYFESHHIIVVTNYPLKTVLRKPELTGRLAKWSIYLSGFDFKFKPKTVIKSQALADFVAEFSPELEPTMCDEIVTIQDNQPWLLCVDGSSNIRGAGLGVALKSSQGGNMVYSVRCEFKPTNNEVEYEALIAGLDIAHKLGEKHLDVRSDSLLVVNQVNGDFQAKDSKMMSYLKVVKERIAQFDHFSIEQIPRDQNTQVDALANLGSAFSDPFLESIPILHLTTPAIEMKEEVQMNEEIYNWSLDIWNYLKHDNLPEDKMEARKTRSKASRYTIFEDQLYRRSTSGLLLRCVISQAQMNRVLQEMHDGECGDHAGAKALLTRSYDKDIIGQLYKKMQ
ncbi:hypothetical protein OSB04_011496 [Centaurea solstitialis]|uniref:Reverse transcriptase n=1 Tax=Centaurea solstitialis TaxID=347529 RepID=A0AA38WCZ9_9ASTR|nr:hypothetical protein OSB04_011496 [Centaurea solstitialis]